MLCLFIHSFISLCTFAFSAGDTCTWRSVPLYWPLLGPIFCYACPTPRAVPPLFLFAVAFFLLFLAGLCTFRPAAPPLGPTYSLCLCAVASCPPFFPPAFSWATFGMADRPFLSRLSSGSPIPAGALLFAAFGVNFFSVCLPAPRSLFYNGFASFPLPSPPLGCWVAFIAFSTSLFSFLSPDAPPLCPGTTLSPPAQWTSTLSQSARAPRPLIARHSFPFALCV